MKFCLEKCIEHLEAAPHERQARVQGVGSDADHILSLAGGRGVGEVRGGVGDSPADPVA